LLLLANMRDVPCTMLLLAACLYQVESFGLGPVGCGFLVGGAKFSA